jgi:DNA-binding transcriptional LysR family regulator
LAGRSGLTLEEVRQYPLVGTAIPARLAQLASGKGTGMPSSLPEGVAAPEIRVETVGLVRRIVMESDAIGGAVLRQIADEVALGRLVPLALDVPWLTTNYGIIRLANRTPGPAATAFMKILREVEAEIA